jgi:hypothetical protein
MHRNTCARTRADLDVDGLEAAHGALSVGELLVNLDGRRGIERRGLEAGAQHVDASRVASAAICGALRVNVKASSVMVMVKCLAIL